MDSISIHDVTNISENLTQKIEPNGSYVKHIVITSKDGTTTRIALFADAIGSLIVRETD